MRENKWIAAGTLAGTLYLCVDRLFPLPDFLAGLLLGLAAVSLVMGLLPPAARDTVRRWKRRG